MRGKISGFFKNLLLKYTWLAEMCHFSQIANSAKSLPPNIHICMQQYETEGGGPSLSDALAHVWLADNNNLLKHLSNLLKGQTIPSGGGGGIFNNHLNIALNFWKK